LRYLFETGRIEDANKTIEYIQNAKIDLDMTNEQLYSTKNMVKRQYYALYIEHLLRIGDLDNAIKYFSLFIDLTPILFHDDTLEFSEKLATSLIKALLVKKRKADAMRIYDKLKKLAMSYDEPFLFNKVGKLFLEPSKQTKSKKRKNNRGRRK
jgi:tetratricopeptide (TPR) repeat protein